MWKNGGNRQYFETMVDGWQTQKLFWVAAGQKTGYPGAAESGWYARLLAADTYVLVTESNSLLSLDV